jgi:hypothetical protein
MFFLIFSFLYRFLVFGGTLPFLFLFLSPLGLASSRHLKNHFGTLVIVLAFCNDLVVVMRVNCSLGNLDPEFNLTLLCFLKSWHFACWCI